MCPTHESILMAALALDTLHYRNMYNLDLCILRSCNADLTHTSSFPIEKKIKISFFLYKLQSYMLKACTIENQFFQSLNGNQNQEDIHKILMRSNSALKNM